jgi:hypothetical protein
MFVKELGKKAGVPSVYTLPFCMLGQWFLLKTINGNLLKRYGNRWFININPIVTELYRSDPAKAGTNLDKRLFTHKEVGPINGFI